ncbi:alanine racemase [Sphaerotilus microaerophilus]|uniref:Alanine racemase n=1 Tax=Sphaerotilus microaerophilus TaxID=2914710 RepID=A0ABN6PVZ8_9BURK|nr:alanine racemase [Sphaerotilus sp. FB-5]BDI07286.1 alanine racemase [Sphaerotilus sp. FB-5]
MHDANAPLTRPLTRPLADLETPALLLDEPRLQANLQRMAARMAQLGVRLRPHVKTAKCLPVAAATDSANLAAGVPGAGERGPITVSTLREADQFAAAGWRDITYAVGLTANKFAHVHRLLDAGVALTVILDSVDAARALSAAAADWPVPVAVLIEVDTDGQRAGLRPDGAALLEVAAALSGSGVRLDGVLTHCGGAYHAHGEAALRAIAEQERAGAVQAAQRLRAAGFAAPVVSVGSTPTALFAEQLAGVTEVRAGVYVFMDLMMAALGVCRLDEIAASVLTSVIGHQPDKGWTLIDAGWMALSRDRGLAGGFTDQGLGLICDADGRVIGDGGGEWIVSSANQEHGIVTHRSGDPARRLDLPVGTLLRVLPNHACATAAQHPHYELLGADGAVRQRWARFMGW